jgi:hypothetical protein
MKTSTTLAAALVAASIMTLATAASAAAPAALGGASQALKSEAGSGVEPVDYRCWWNGHRRVCGYVRPAPQVEFFFAPPRRHYYGYGYGYGYGHRSHGFSHGFRRHGW